MMEGKRPNASCEECPAPLGTKVRAGSYVCICQQTFKELNAKLAHQNECKAARGAAVRQGMSREVATV